MNVPRALYDTDYYLTNCEGFEHSVDRLSPRLRSFEGWVDASVRGVVLDVGFGRGEIVLRAARLPAVRKVVAVDYSPAAGRLLLERLEGCDDALIDKILVVVGDANEVLDLLSPPIDYAILFDVVEHLFPAQIAGLFERLARVMRPGGKAFVITPISACLPNERHVWLARTRRDLDPFASRAFDIRYAGFTGSGEDHRFELTRRAEDGSHVAP